MANTKRYYVQNESEPFPPFTATESEHPGQVGFSEFLGEQREHGQRALEGDHFLQDASSSDTLQVLASLQKEEPRSIRLFFQQFLDKQRYEKPLDNYDHLYTAALRTSEKLREHLQSNAKRLQLRIRVYSQFTRGIT